MRIIFYLRGLIVTPFAILATAICAAVITVCGAVFKNQNWVSQSIYLWSLAVHSLFNIRIELKGEENIPKGGCIFLFNHTSVFDITAVHQVIRKHVRFGAKAELFKIPIFGHGMRAGGYLEIFRAEKGKVFELYKKSIERVRDGESFALAAEGTRHSMPGVGSRFKAGPFIFAITGQIPIVPVVIHGAYECLSKGEWLACRKQWRSHIVVQVLPAISTKGLSIDQRQELQKQAQNIMTSAYKNC